MDVFIQMVSESRCFPSCYRSLLGEPTCVSNSSYKGTLDVFHKVIRQVRGTIYLYIEPGLRENVKKKKLTNTLVIIHLNSMHMCTQVICKQFAQYAHVHKNQKTTTISQLLRMHMCIPSS